MNNILLFLEVDLSLSTGAAINERESVISLLQEYSDSIFIIAPSPQFPDVYYDQRIYYIKNHGRHSPLLYLRFLLYSWLKIRKLIKVKKIGIAVFRLGLWPVLPVLTSVFNIPVVLKTFSGYAMFERTDRRLLFKVLSKLLWPFYKNAVKLSKAIDTPSHALSSWAVHRFNFDKDNILVLPNGANIRDFQPSNVSKVAAQFGYDHFQHIIGYVGAMDSIRYLDEAIAAMTYLKNDSSVGLVLVGKGPSLDFLKRTVNDHKLNDKVFFLGFQTYEMIPDIINSFDIAFDLTRVILRVAGEDIIGSYSQKIPQYLACGVPVIAHQCSDTDFIEKNNLGKTIPQKNPQFLAKTIELILKDCNLDKYKKDKIRAYAVEHLSYNALAKKRIDFWKNINNAKI